MDNPLVISLFSGIGGIDLAAEEVGFKVAVMVEIDPFCQSVLKKHFPDAILFSDVRHVTRRKLIKRLYQRGYLTHDPSFGPLCSLVVGGPPCQAASLAGSRKGAEDERWLWPEYWRIVGEIRPGWVFAENVPGLYTVDAGRGFRGILWSLSSLGYRVGWCTFGAGDVGAPHERQRIFIVAHTNIPHVNRSGNSRTERWIKPSDCGERLGGESNRDDPRGADWPTEPILGRMLDGFPSWMDGGRWPAPLGAAQYEWEPPRTASKVKNRVARLKALGNAVVRDQAIPILAAIAEELRDHQ